jgi:hypothetical protein
MTTPSQEPDATISDTAEPADPPGPRPDEEEFDPTNPESEPLRPGASGNVPGSSEPGHTLPPGTLQADEEEN